MSHFQNELDKPYDNVWAHGLKDRLKVAAAKDEQERLQHPNEMLRQLAAPKDYYPLG